MAIKTRKEGDQTFYEVSVKSRSPTNRLNQVQRQNSGVLKGLSDEEVHKKLQRIEMHLYGDARAEVAIKEGKGLTWAKLIAKWEVEALEDKDVLESLDLSMQSANGYLQAIRDHTDGWKKLYASEITAVEFESLVLNMRKAGYSNSTIYNLKSAINCCYKWAIKKRMVPNVSVPPTYGCTISRKSSRRPEVLNYSEICFLLEKAEELKHEWYPIWKIVLHTGIRSGEALALKAKDIILEEARIMLDTKFNFKSRKEEQLKDCEWRQVAINPELKSFFISLGIQQMSPEDYVLPRIKAWKHGEAARILRSFCEEIKITSICFHTLRACWATQLLRNGVAQSKVMIMGGWADLETMQVYLRRAGVEIQGATDSLSFERKRERPGRILKIVGKSHLGSLDDEFDSE